MSRRTFGLQFHITDRCDQRCKHCYIFAGKDIPKFNEFSLEELKSIVENLKDSCDKLDKKPFIAVTGGDPLLHPNIFEFLEYLHQNHINFSILGLITFISLS